MSLAKRIEEQVARRRAEEAARRAVEAPTSTERTSAVEQWMDADAEMRNIRHVAEAREAAIRESARTQHNGTREVEQTVRVDAPDADVESLGKKVLRIQAEVADLGAESLRVRDQHRLAIDEMKADFRNSRSQDFNENLDRLRAAAVDERDAAMERAQEARDSNVRLGAERDAAIRERDTARAIIDQLDAERAATGFAALNSARYNAIVAELDTALATIAAQRTTIAEQRSEIADWRRVDPQVRLDEQTATIRAQRETMRSLKEEVETKTKSNNAVYESFVNMTARRDELLKQLDLTQHQLAVARRDAEQDRILTSERIAKYNAAAQVADPLVATVPPALLAWARAIARQLPEIEHPDGAHVVLPAFGGSPGLTLGELRAWLKALGPAPAASAEPVAKTPGSVNGTSATSSVDPV